MSAKIKGIKNIILISIDCLRFDCIGYQPDKRFLERYGVLPLLDTPNLDRIAEKGVCFTQAVSTCSYTPSSHASIFTGLYPPKHGVQAFFRNSLNPKAYTLAQYLREAGFSTFLYTDFEPHFKYTDLARGVDYFFGFPQYTEEDCLKAFEESMNDKRGYLFAHFSDVHLPYLHSYFEHNGYNDDFLRRIEELSIKANGSAGQVIRECVSPDDIYSIHQLYRYYINLKMDLERKEGFGEFLLDYVKGVSKFDKGRFAHFLDHLERLGLLDNSLIIIFSDHGEASSSFSFDHGGFPYDGVIRIPLIFHHPPTLAPMIIDRQVSSVDIILTILDILDIPIKHDGQVDGKSLLSMMENCFEYEGSSAYSEVWSGCHHSYTMSAMEESMEKAKFIPATGGDIIFQRSYREPQMKFVIHGLDEHELTKMCEDSNLSDEEFVKGLIRGILLRYEDEEELKLLCKHLNEGVKRETLLKGFMLSHGQNKYLLFDLIADPFEEREIQVKFNGGDVNLNFNSKIGVTSQLLEKYKDFILRARETIMGIYSKKIASQEEIMYESENEFKQVRERLKALGYLS